MLAEKSPILNKQTPLEHHNRNKEAKERSPTQEIERHQLNELLRTATKMMKPTEAEEFLKGVKYTSNLLKFINSVSEITISQQTVNELLKDGVNRVKENQSGTRSNDFGISYSEKFDFVRLFENKKGVEFANSMARKSDIKDQELYDFLTSTSDNPAFQAGGKLVLKAYEYEASYKDSQSIPMPLNPNVAVRLKSA